MGRTEEYIARDELKMPVRLEALTRPQDSSEVHLQGLGGVTEDHESK